MVKVVLRGVQVIVFVAEFMQCNYDNYCTNTYDSIDRCYPAVGRSNVSLFHKGLL
jgi:hypothetical protein